MQLKITKIKAKTGRSCSTNNNKTFSLL